MVKVGFGSVTEWAESNSTGEVGTSVGNNGSKLCR